MKPLPSADASAGEPSSLSLGLAFAAIYLVWGSTYLAIRFAIETMPPFTMAALRFWVAGGLLFGWARMRGVARPTRREWGGSAVVGGLLLLGGNGAVVWAEQWVPSGLTALLVATVPLWMVLLDWLWAGASRPGRWSWFGIGWGLFGVWLLVGGSGQGILTGPALVGGLVVVLGALSWAWGSILSRSLELPASPRMATALQMLAGGTLLGLAGAVTGEWSHWDVGATSMKSLLALAYLVVFGALVGYAAYIWLLRVTTAGRVATYAYVNPVVALLLGWALADEPLSIRTGVAAVVILSAVVVLNRVSVPRRRRATG
jgi:drug/metabolite transporter (DMT)-like permease